MHTVEPILKRVVRVCDSLGLRYYVTGSIASMFYGEPRYTEDVDIVVELPSSKVRPFCAEFPDSEFYVSPEAATEAALRGGQFNILHSTEGVKADIIVPRDEPFESHRFSRKRLEQVTVDCQAYVSSPEDVILSKLVFFHEGQSDKHLRDIAGMFAAGRAAIDRAYIDQWALRLGVAAEWRMMQDRLREVLPPGSPGRP